MRRSGKTCGRCSACAPQSASSFRTSSPPWTRQTTKPNRFPFKCRLFVLVFLHRSPLDLWGFDKASIQTKPDLVRMSSFHVGFFCTEVLSRSMGFWWADIGILKKWRINLKYSWISAGRTCCHVEKKFSSLFYICFTFTTYFCSFTFMKSCFIISKFFPLYSSTNNNQSLWSGMKWC